MSRELILARGDRIAVVAPHPDDETLAAGGLLQHALAAGASVQVLVATDGDDNPWAQRAVEGRWRVDAHDRERWGLRRRGEAAEALRRLGVPSSAVIFLGFHDQTLTDVVLTWTRDGVHRLADPLAAFRPTLVVTPAMADRHPDHSALAVLVRLALARRGRRAPAPAVVSYLVHPPRAAMVSVRERCVHLTGAEIVRKRAAISAHRSQLRLRRHALLGFAGPHEDFVLARPECWRMPGGPVRRSRVEGDCLRVTLARERHLGVFGASTLCLLTDARAGSGCWLGTLPTHAGPFRLTRRGDAEAVPARLLRDGHDGEIVVPAGILDGANAAFLKIQRRFGWFDESGWSELSVGRDAHANDRDVHANDREGQANDREGGANGGGAQPGWPSAASTGSRSAAGIAIAEPP